VAEAAATTAAAAATLPRLLVPVPVREALALALVARLEVLTLLPVVLLAEQVLLLQPRLHPEVLALGALF
jgi:hypothetical protein